MPISKKIILSAGAALAALMSFTLNTVYTTSQVEASQPATSAARSENGQVKLAQAPMSSLKIAFATRRDATDLQRKADAVAQILSRQLGMPVTAIVADETAAVEALRANRVDVAFLSSRPALKAEELAGSRMFLAETRDNYSGGKTYNSIYVVLKDSPLRSQPTTQQTLAQLRGKRMAFTSRTSGSGFIMPVAELVSRKLVDGPDRLENFFSKVSYGDSYTSALQAVLRGQADVATVSEYALLPPWITTEEGGKLRVLRAISGVPAHGIAIDDDVPVELREKIITAFLEFNKPENNEVFRNLYNSTKLVRVDHNRHLSTVREALKLAGLKP